MIQQGDVILESVKQVEGNACKSRDGFYVLAEGESTGHMHKTQAVAGVEFYEKDGMFYLVNKTGHDVEIQHEEHKTVYVPDGVWKVRKVREYDHFAEEARDVAD